MQAASWLQVENHTYNLAQIESVEFLGNGDVMGNGDVIIVLASGGGKTYSGDTAQGIRRYFTPQPAPQPELLYGRTEPLYPEPHLAPPGPSKIVEIDRDQTNWTPA
jgi:hypothetical protein